MAMNRYARGSYERSVDRMPVHGKPVQLIQMKNGKLELDKKALEAILMQPRLKDMPVMVVSIAGVFRSGKSYLLNLLVNHLSQNVNRQNGFVWNAGSDRVTTGIWMWSEVFTITLPDGRNVGIILLDTQGTQDPKTPQKNNAAVFALSTILSSIQMYNVKDFVDEGDLQFLELFIRYGIAIKGDDKKPFETMLFLIRDWRGHREFAFGEDGGNNYLKKCMATNLGDQAKENVEVRENIAKVFNNLNCFLMPTPGDDVCEGNPTLKGVLEETSKRFQDNFMNLVQTLFASSKITKVQRIDDKDMTCGRLCAEIQEHTRSINHGKGFNITSMAEANAIAHESKMFRKVISDFNAKMDKISETYQVNLKGIMENEKRQALADFKKKCGPSPSQEYGDQEEALRKAIEGKIQTIIANIEMKKAKAAITNLKVQADAKGLFAAGMKKALPSIKPNTLNHVFEQQKKLALEHFKKNGHDFGESFKEKMTELADIFTKEYQHYKSIIDEGMKGTAYQYALDAYTNTMKEKYETYQQPEYEQDIHEEAWENALAAYRRAGVGEMSMTDCPTLKLMREKRKEYGQSNNQIKKNADKNNDAAHNKALTYYRDLMQDKYVNILGFDERHRDSENTALRVYEQDADKRFQSYEINKTSLKTGIHAVHEEFRKQRTIGNWCKSWIGKQKYVLIPNHLLK